MLDIGTFIAYESTTDIMVPKKITPKLHKLNKVPSCRKEPKKSLAFTGLDSTAMGLGALVLSAAGGTLIAIHRRKNAL